MTNRPAGSFRLCLFAVLFTLCGLALGGPSIPTDRPAAPGTSLTAPLQGGGPTWQVGGGQAGAKLGTALASAGDVNGDGIDDIIAGAPGYDSPSTPNPHEGRALVYLGSVLGPSTIAVWSADGAQTAFGTAAASAGDVNGDGFDDIVVGEPDFSVNAWPFTGQGQASLYLGSASGPAATAAWTGQAAENDHFGAAVASAGDVNSDGYGDVIIGAPNPQSRGKAFLYLGSPAGLSTTAAWSVQSPGAGASPDGPFGSTVAGAGDVNGDGFDDVLVGEPGFRTNCTVGRALLYYGSSSGPSTTPAWTLTGQVFCDFQSSSVGCSLTSGNFDGDAYGDFVIGCPSSQGPGMLFRGSPSGPVSTSWRAGSRAQNAGDVNGDQLDDLITASGSTVSIYLGRGDGLETTPAWTASMSQSGTGFGSVVAGAGDTDGDGLANVLAGASLYDFSQTDDGAAFLFFGPIVVPCATDADADGYCASGPAGDCNDTDPDVYPGATEVCNGRDDNCTGQADEGFGVGTACSNGYGICKVGGTVVCAADGTTRCDGPAPGAPASEVCDGVDNDCDGAIDDGQPDTCRIASTPQTGAHLGASVADVGDVNGDGFDDVVAGAPDDANGRLDLYYGSASGHFRTPDRTYSGTQVYGGSSVSGPAARFGAAAAGIGDLDHDGYDDFIVGAPGYFYFTLQTQIGSSGAVYLMRGGPAGPAMSTFVIGANLSTLGSAVAGGGDVDGDGVGDFVVAGRGTPLNVSPRVVIWTRGGTSQGTLLGNSSTSTFGRAVAIAPDVNGDGFDDLVVTANSPDAAAVYYGGASGIGSTPSLLLQSSLGPAQAIAGVGDVNRDGYGDVLFGWAGRASLHFGSGTGLATTPAWTYVGPSGSEFGGSLSRAGDVNGDGDPDFVVGAPTYRVGTQSRGAAYLFLGGPGGPASTPAWIGTLSEQTGTRFGAAVSGAGDYDRDGLDDVIVGAPEHDSGGASQSGRADLVASAAVFGSDPVAAIAAPASAECDRPAGASVVLDGSGSTDPDSSAGTNDDIASFDWYEAFGTPDEHLLASGETVTVDLPRGAHDVTLKTTDRSGRTDTASATVTVRDTQPPSLLLSADPGSLWPPNHHLFDVNVAWQTTDACDAAGVAVTLLSAVSSEPDDAPGNSDGATTGDVQGADIGAADAALLLRAERDAQASGRVYTLTYRAQDASGNATTALATVTVPHDRGQGPEPLLMQVEPAGPGSTRLRAFWPAVPGAIGYDVISGDLQQWHVANGALDIGPVTVLARSTTVTSLTEAAGAVPPPPGHAVFYLIQQRTPSAVGYGTEGAPLPRIATICEDGCP